MSKTPKSKIIKKKVPAKKPAKISKKKKSKKIALGGKLSAKKKTGSSVSISRKPGTTAGKLGTYDPSKIESKWQKIWQKSKVYFSKEDSKNPKYYILDMFPYPSGEGLHVGHPKGYIATDIISRFKRMNGHSVLHPMGFDAFGLPAENYALKTKTNPADSVKKNVARYKKQLEIMGFDYDWSREINTTDPAYYKWTQWIFLRLLEKGLAYQSFEPINWCPSCKTGLANEDVEDGRCERCGTPVEKKPMRQWVLKITDYAERLLADLEAENYVMPVLVDKVNPHQPGKPIVSRSVAHAIVFDPKNRKYLIIRNKKFGWDTVVIGGIENGENPEETARREIREETGYVDVEFKRILGGKTEAHYYTKHKGENRIATAQAVYFELKSDKRVPVAEDEDKDNEVLWVDETDFVPGKMVNSELPIWLERLKNHDSGLPQPLLDWPESIKTSQKNWIGKSEGALIKFKIQSSNLKKESQKDIEVFTTRPDTLFGVTYLVLAPEHKLVSELMEFVENQAEVKAYVLRAKDETEIQRTDAKKEKTGVELKGIKVVNPANNETVPVWIADYVLADYGTGAVMAVPAHDERDWAFAKKFNLPIKQVIAPYFTKTVGKDHVEPKKKTILRKTAYALVLDEKNDRFLCLNWTKHDWHSGIIGGVDEGETYQEAALREIKEETGYINVEYVKDLGMIIHNHFFAAHKDVNRYAIGQCMLFRLKDLEKIETKEEDTKNHTTVWIKASEMESWLNLVAFKYAWQAYKAGNYCYEGAGKLLNSTKFNDRDSESVMKEITEFVGGQWVTKFKLRDWVFSRQRYWGEPIPVIHCENCAKKNPAGQGIVPVPEKDLPVTLPRVKFYEPTGTGESPLAAIEKWVKVKCPVCKGPAKRETNTMPQWAGSSWYYLRYMDPKNKKALVDPKKEKYWAPVDTYVGGAEHATRHLIYARFWHKFLYDLGLVSTVEPFTKLQHVGLIMGEDGRKMSKRFGNVINPDDIVKTYGADTLRLYEMFMGPFDQQIAWSTSSIVGTRRFIEKVWKLNEKVQAGGQSAATVRKAINLAIGKVTEDIENMRYNTAISALMIAVNELEKASSITKSEYETLLKLIAPFSPHFTEEIWSHLGNKGSIHEATWPKYDPDLAKEDTVTIMVQVNGKIRGSFEVASGADRARIEQMAQEIEAVKKWLEGKSIVKIIVIPNRLVNIVLG